MASVIFGVLIALALFFYVIPFVLSLVVNKTGAYCLLAFFLFCVVALLVEVLPQSLLPYGDGFLGFIYVAGCLSMLYFVGEWVYKHLTR